MDTDLTPPEALAAGASRTATDLPGPICMGAPLAGWATALEDVPDPVFAGRVLGDGIAIDPTEDVLRAPCAGVITTLHRAHHALTIRADCGAEILMHIGLDTVALNGQGFTPLVHAGQTVAQGEPLIRFDLEQIAQAAPSLLVPIIVTNLDAFSITGRSIGRAVAAGTTVLRLAPAAPSQAAAAAGVEAVRPDARQDVTITAPYGIHARPAGLLAQKARSFAADVRLRCKDRVVSARGAVGLMGLGVQRGDVVSVEATGPDAAAAVQAVAEILGSDLGDTTEPPPGPAVSAAPVPRAAPLATVALFQPGEPIVLQGVTGAPGVAVGQAAALRRREFDLSGASQGAATETQRLRAAVTAAQAELRATLAADPDRHRPAHAILSAHLAFLEDPELLAQAEAFIATDMNAGAAWHAAIRGQVATLRGLGDTRLAERADDLLDVERRVLSALSGGQTAPEALPPGAILFADDLLPSQLAGIEAGRLAGICTAGGGATSHVSIMAGSMGIPALVATGIDALRVPDGASVILDADAGTARIFVEPDEMARTRDAVVARQSRRAEALRRAQEDAFTADGVCIEVVANLGGVADVRVALDNGAEGCGLLRSEFLFLNRTAAPSEDEQTAQYQAIASGLNGRPLIIRTLDAGADKRLPYLQMQTEENPQLGVRGIRLGLACPELLRTQLRAILRVQPASQCRIMLPMVATADELRQARAMLAQEIAALGRAEPIPLGIMIEVPAAALLSAELASEADFFSIGTNDLTQYVLAMDRLNPALARQMDALHPAVLRMIGMTVEGAHRHGRWVGVCGGLASVPLAAPVLIGLGVTELSATSAAVPQVKAMIRRVTMAECEAAARDALRQESAQAVRAALLERWPEV